MPALGADAWSLLIHHECLLLEPLDIARLLHNVGLHSSLFIKLGLRRILLLLKHVSHSQDGRCYQAAWFTDHNAISEALVLPISSTCPNLLHHFLDRLAGRPLPWFGTSLVHLRERLRQLQWVLVVCVHNDDQYLPRICDCKWRMLLLGLVPSLRDLAFPCSTMDHLCHHFN